jgi:hypothetical protein
MVVAFHAGGRMKQVWLVSHLQNLLSLRETAGSTKEEPDAV